MKCKDEPCQDRCRDEDLTDYYAHGWCSTPLCPGWAEFHCRECGWFFSECGCGSESGCSMVSRRATISARNRGK